MLQEVLIVTRVAVVLHERLGTWAGQLRPRLQDRPVRWYETRSTADLDEVLTGLASPVVLIDLARYLLEGLSDLGRVVTLAPGARVLVLDPEAHEEVATLARELGATLVISGFVPPPEVAELIDRWILLASMSAASEGWSKRMAIESPPDAESWLETARLALSGSLE
jgi:hypothetical protein